MLFLRKLNVTVGIVNMKSLIPRLLIAFQGSDPAAVVPPVPAPGTTVAVTEDAPKAVPRVQELVRVHLEQLDVHDDLGLRLVVHLDEPLGHGHLVGRVADDDRVQRRDRAEPAQVQDRPHHGRDVLHVAVREEERPDDEVLVLLAVLLRVLRDEDRLLVDDLVEVAGLPHRGLEGLLERQAPEVEREFVVLELRVVDDVDARRGAQGRVDLLDVRVGRERHVDRFRRRRVQHRRSAAQAPRVRAFAFSTGVPPAFSRLRISMSALALRNS